MLNDESIEKILDGVEEEGSPNNEPGFEKRLEEMRNYSGEDKVITASEFKAGTVKEVDLYRAGSGISELDKIIGGFRPGNLIIVSGPTKQGKTTFCQTLTRNLSRQNYKCLWFSFDTPAIELIDRFDKSLPIFYLPKRNLPEKKLEWIESRIIEGISKFNIRMIFIDHLEFLTRFTDKSSNYSTELTAIVRELKSIAIQWNVTIFLNHHIRSIDLETVPNYTHLKNSSGPAQDSDLTLMVWREKVKGQFGIEYTDNGFISVELNRRTGKTGKIRVKFDNNFFKDFESESVSDPALNSKSF